MHIAKVFNCGNSQAIRIPKEVRTNEQEFYIRKLGKGYVLIPTNDPWYTLHHSIGTVSKSFMTDTKSAEK